MKFTQYYNLREALEKLTDEDLETLSKGEVSEGFLAINEDEINEDELEKLVKAGKAKWITAQGHHTCVDNDGNILSGKFKGTNMSDISSVAQKAHK